MRISNYIFFDGVNQYNVFEKYDNWLTSLNYDDYSKSYVEVNNVKIYLFDLYEELTSDNFKIEKLEEISSKYDLIFKNDERLQKCVAKSHVVEKFFITEKNRYVIIFSLGGTKSFELIYIHGVWND